MNGARYHVASQTHRKERTLDPIGVRILFLDVVAKAKKHFKFSIENFCIMGTHFHFIIKPADNENLSRIMQWIKAMFAITYNRRYGVIGSFWGGRFFSRILGSLREYIKTFEYIDENPVKAGLVDNPCDWHFGGLFHRNQGRGDIVDPLPCWLAAFQPARSLLPL